MPPQKTSPTVRPSDLQAESLQQTRREHAMEITEDYVEAIADLSASQGEARVTDLARQLGVTHVTVTRTLSRLQRTGYVTAKPYRAIFLTEAGHSLATACKKRHEVVVAFLLFLGISKKTAEIDAEGIEHHISPKPYKAFLKKMGNS